MAKNNKFSPSITGLNFTWRRIKFQKCVLRCTKCNKFNVDDETRMYCAHCKLSWYKFGEKNAGD